MSVHRTLLMIVVGVLSTATANSTVTAGLAPPPFEVEAYVNAAGDDSTGNYDLEESASTVAMLPLMVNGSLVDVSSSASASFVEFGAYSQNSLASGTNAQSNALAADTLTIFPNGVFTGATRLDMTWQVEGALSGSGNQQATLRSTYRMDALGSGQPNQPFQMESFSGEGTINESVTFSYEDIPIGMPWNLRTQLLSSVNDGPGESDFSSTATLTDVIFYVDDVAVPATITGASGQTYAVVPEPSAFLFGSVVAALVGACSNTRRQRRCRTA